MPRKQIHYIYKTTCNVTGRYYIGMHSTANLEDGYLGSGKRLRYSLKKYGRENHTKEILEFLESREDLKNRESQLINEDLLKDSRCMNLQPGGGGGLCGTDHEVKLHAGASDWIKKKWADPEYVQKQKKLSSARFKKTHATGKIKYDTFTGKKHKPESKNKIGDANSISQRGSFNSQFGTIWITDGLTNRKIKNIDFIPTNWKRGRTIHATHTR